MFCKIVLWRFEKALVCFTETLAHVYLEKPGNKKHPDQCFTQFQEICQRETDWELGGIRVRTFKRKKHWGKFYGTIIFSFPNFLSKRIHVKRFTRELRARESKIKAKPTINYLIWSSAWQHSVDKCTVFTLSFWEADIMML